MIDPLTGGVAAGLEPGVGEGTVVATAEVVEAVSLVAVNPGKVLLPEGRLVVTTGEGGGDDAGRGAGLGALCRAVCEVGIGSGSDVEEGFAKLGEDSLLLLPW